MNKSIRQKVKTRRLLGIIWIVCAVYLAYQSVKNDLWHLLEAEVLILGLGFGIYKYLMACEIYMISEKCRIRAYLKLPEYLVKKKRNRANVKLHLSLYYAYWHLGMDQEAERESQYLQGMIDQFSEAQKIRFLLSMNQTGKAQQILDQVEWKKGKDKDKEDLQSNISLHRFMNNGEWKEAVDILLQIQEPAVIIQVQKAYLLGVCYWEEGRYREALEELNFVIAYGGDTKYVSLARKLQSSLPCADEQTHTESCKKAVGNSEIRIRMAAYGAFSALCLVGLLAVGYHEFSTAEGSTMIETYAEKYHANEENIEILYQEELPAGEYAILSDQKYMIYVLYKKVRNEESDSYWMQRMYRVAIEELAKDYPDYVVYIDEASGSPGFSQKSNAGMEIYETIKQFYQKETETFGEKFACAGISYYPNADEITIDDKLVRIIRTDEFHGKTIYLWQVEVDLENMDFFDVEYLF